MSEAKSELTREALLIVACCNDDDVSFNGDRVQDGREFLDAGQNGEQGEESLGVQVVVMCVVELHHEKESHA